MKNKFTQSYLKDKKIKNIAGIKIKDSSLDLEKQHK